MAKLFIFILSFLFGIVLYSVSFNLHISSLMFLSVSLCILVFFISLRVKKETYLFGVFVVGFSLGLLRFHLALPAEESKVLDYFAQEEIEISLEGLIISAPEQKSSYQKFVFESRNFLIDDRREALSTTMSVSSNSPGSFEYGDTVSVKTVVKKPEAFETQGGRMFSYDTFLLKDGIYYTVSRAQVFELSERIDLTLGQKTVRSLYRFKNKLISVTNKKLPQPHTGLLAGILFGEKSALPQPVQDQFRAVGLTHIIVLSGYNVSLVIQLFLGVLRFLPLRTRSLLAVGGIIAFALLVGAGPTVIRASIMAVFLVLANIVGRPYHVVRALVAAGFVMVLINPWILLFDLSFQLSFLATAGLIILSPIFERYFKNIPNMFEFRSSLIATVSAQIAVTPLILYSIGEFSIISPIVNTLTLFAVPWAMLFGFLLSFVPFFSGVLVFLSYFSLHYILIVVDMFSQIPFAVIVFPKFHISLMFLAYGLIILWLLKYHKKIASVSV